MPPLTMRVLVLLLLALLAPQPAEPQVMKTCAGNAAATLRPEQPYRALWNAAWPGKCAGYAKPPNISAFGIDTNGGPNSTREGVAICTPGPTPKGVGTGLYPMYDCLRWPAVEKNCQPINGGSPQLANLSAHLEAFKADVVRLMPDPQAATAINLDWEKWDPTWAGTLPERTSMCGPNGTCVTNPVHDCKYCKYYIYGEVARRVARQDHPDATPEQIEGYAKDGWEKASVNFLVQTLKAGKALRPNAHWGFWDLVPGGHVDWSIGADAGTKKNLQPLWDAMDALYPSIYIPSVTSGAADATYVGNKLKQSRLLADAHLKDGAPMPIYAYTMMEAMSVDNGKVGGPLLSGKQFDAEYELPGKYGIAGLAIYGGSNDGTNPTRCAEVAAWAGKQLLPSMKTFIAERNACAAQHCSGHGRCVDYDGDATRTCACMAGWKGAACGTKV